MKWPVSMRLGNAIVECAGRSRWLGCAPATPARPSSQLPVRSGLKFVADRDFFHGMKIRPLGLVFGLCFAASIFAAEEHPVTIKQNPVKITHRTFDPKRPPAAMPKLTPPESGVCHYEFTADAGISVFVDQKGPRTVEVEVDAVDIVLDLPITIWVMKGAPQKLIQHEEGHRQICEDYYKNCGDIARELGKKMIGRKATATGRNKQEAQETAQQMLLTELNDAYLKATRYRCRICQDHYDDITTHGLKPIAEAEAIAQAKVLEETGKVPSVGLPVVNPERTRSKG